MSAWDSADVISPRISCADPCISSDYPIHIDTIRMELSILYFKPTKISIKNISVMSGCVFLG